MSLTRSLVKLLGALRGLKTRQQELTKQVADLQRRVYGFEAKRDAMSVPPGSTFLDADRFRLFRPTAADAVVATAKIQTLDENGNPIDDPVDTADYSLYRARPDAVAAYFEGTDQTGDARYFMLPAIFNARVTASTGGSNQWTYTITQIHKSSTGYDGWTDTPGGRSGTAYNFNEDQNAATGLQGNGVDQANLDAVNNSGGGTDGTHALQPIPNGTRVLCMEVPVWDGTKVTDVEYWIINLPNGVDGVCPVPA